MRNAPDIVELLEGPVLSKIRLVKTWELRCAVCHQPYISTEKPAVFNGEPFKFGLCGRERCQYFYDIWL